MNSTGNGQGSGSSMKEGEGDISSNNKRKRDDDDYDNDRREEEHEGNNDYNDDDNSNNSAVPEAVVSRENNYDDDDDDDDIDFNIPDGEFPHFSQLGRILTKIEAVPVGKFDKRSLQYLKSLVKWTYYETNKDRKEGWLKFKLDFLQVGGLLRMICLIERQMKDIEVVLRASSVCFYLFCRGEASIDEDDEIILSSSATFAMRTGALRILLLASEEFIPSTNSNNWKTAKFIWLAVMNIVVNAHLQFVGREILLPIIEANIADKCLSDPKQFDVDKVFTASAFALVVGEAISEFNDLETIVKEQKIMDSFLIFTQAFMDTIMSEPERSVRILLSLCIVCAKVLSSEDMKNWLPFVATALPKHIKDDVIEKKAYRFFVWAVDNINHRELDSSPLMDTLLSIIKSSDTPEALKTKYRKLMAKILS